MWLFAVSATIAGVLATVWLAIFTIESINIVSVDSFEHFTVKRDGALQIELVMAITKHSDVCALSEVQTEDGVRHAVFAVSDGYETTQVFIDYDADSGSRVSGQHNLPVGVIPYPTGGAAVAIFASHDCPLAVHRSTKLAEFTPHPASSS